MKLSVKKLQTSSDNAILRAGGPLRDDKRQEIQQMFLDAFALHGTVTKATKDACIDRTTVYLWLKTDVPFANAYAEAIIAYNDVIRDALHDRGIVGIQKALFQKGQPVLDVNGKQVYEIVHSDAILALIARARLPEYKHADVNPQAVTGVVMTEHSLIIEDIRQLSTDVLDSLLQDLDRLEMEKNTYASNTIVNESRPQSTAS